MEGPEDSTPAQCQKLAEGILHKEAACMLGSCSFNSVYQPNFAETFSPGTGPVMLLSFFFDRVNELGFTEKFDLNELDDLREKVCGGEKSWSSFSSIAGAIEGLRDRPESCLDLSFMMALLRTGYEMPMETEVTIAKTLKGNELGWCLGASLPYLEQESGWKCRVKEVQ